MSLLEDTVNRFLAEIIFSYGTSPKKGIIGADITDGINYWAITARGQLETIKES